MAQAVSLKRNIVLRRGIALVLVGVIAVFAIQALRYAGVAERVGEWQFAHVGGYFPLLTLALVVLLLGVPALLFARRHDADTDSQSEAAIASARRFLHVLLIGFVLAAGMAGQRLWVGYAQVYTGGQPRPLDAGTAPGADFRRGMVRLTGRVHYDRQAEVGSHLWFVTQRARFVPVTAGRDAAAVTYLVETTQRGLGPRDGVVTGLLVRDALRPDALKLLRDNGYRIATPHYVLFTNSLTLLRPYQMEAAKWGMLALLLGLLAAVQRWRIRNLVPKRKGTAHFTR